MWKGEYHCNKKNGYCGYAKRNRSVFPCSECNEPNEQEPVTCMHCRNYPCKGERQSIRPCKNFVWD